MENILSINLNPYIKSYAHHCFHHAIISSNERICKEDEAVAVVEIKDFEKYKWFIKTDSLKFIKKDKLFSFFSTNKWNQNLNAVFVRPIEENDELEIIIHKQLYVAPYANIKIFINDLSNDVINNIDCLNKLDFGIAAKNFCKDGITPCQENIMENVLFPIDIKIYNKNQSIYYSYSNKYKQRDDIFLGKFPESKSSLQIGFAVCLDNSFFYDWLFSNYINLFYVKDRSVQLDYLCNPVKNYNTYSYDFFIDANIEKEWEIKAYNLNLVDFIKKQIDLGRYIEILINDNINAGYTDDRKKFFHQNLIYGYSDKEQKFYNLFFLHGQMKNTKISYEDIISERNFLPNRDLYILKYNPAYEGISFNKESLLNMYLEFQSGKNYSHMSPGIDCYCDITYGLNCYKKLCNEDELTVLLNDFRIAHVILERAICNRDRIEYMLYKKILSDNDFSFLYDILSLQIKEAQILKTNLLKRKMGGEIKKESVMEKIKQITLLEEDFTNNIIIALSK